MAAEHAKHRARAKLAAAAVIGAIAGYVGRGSTGFDEPRGSAPAASGVAATPTAAAAPPIADVSPTSPSAVSAPATPTSAANANPRGLLTAAATGDLDALKRLELEPATERSIDEALAIASGHAALARRDADRLVADIANDPKLLRDPSTARYAYELALDPDVAPTLLVGLARLDTPDAADFIHDLAARGAPGARLVLLAEDVLLGPEVKPEASDALAIALDLQAASDCWKIAALLPRAKTDADDRATATLERLGRSSGCGPKKDEDCLPCLRTPENEKLLADASTAARERKFEAPWKVRGAPRGSAASGRGQPGSAQQRKPVE